MAYRQSLIAVAHQKVLGRLMSGWRRRGASLLQIGLGAGCSPEFFWEAGLDVTVIDSSPDRLAAARGRTGPKIGYVCGNPEHLPFDDGAFDYAVLVHHGLKSGVAEREAVLLEALRAAVRGVIILEWNRFSLCGVPRSAEGLGDFPAREGRPGASARHGDGGMEGVWPWDLCRLVKEHCAGRRLFGVSALPLWEGLWPDPAREGSALRRFCAGISTTPVPLPLGALIGLRVDWTPVPLTPVGMLRSAAASLCAAKPQGEEAMGRTVQRRHQH